MLSDEAMHERMVNGWRMGRPFTECGNGSTLEATRVIRDWLPGLLARLKVRTMNDAGAGDLAWIKLIHWKTPLHYRPFDLIPRLPQVGRIDITRDAMPPADAILCRMVLNHLDRPRIAMALERFRASAPYLIATQYQAERLPQRSVQFQRLDLREWLGEPMESVADGLDEYCTLAVWRL
jgi:hypothetical protein